MITAVMMDTGPLGLVTKRPGIIEADACRHRVDALADSGVNILVPEIADYEIRRELI